MRSSIIAGIVLGFLVAAWTFVMGFTGWYKSPAHLNLFFLVIAFQIVVLVMLLKRTAAGNGYGRQVLLGFVASAVACVIIVPGSLLFTTVVFPKYFEEIRAVQEVILRGQGKSETEISVAIDAAAATQTPMLQALFGAIGTLVVGLVVSAVAGAALRRRGN